uniref:zinc finger protein ZPR1 n=1 Tax=Myxine glutinosa TaxID=7769 RepID=UPI00358FE676
MSVLPAFRDLDFDDTEQTVEMESLCFACGQNGVTRLLITRVPFFKELLVSSFSCPHCSSSNTDVTSAGRIQEKGVCYTLVIQTHKDLNRELVKSDAASVRIPSEDFEIPSFSQKGTLTTVEGLLDRAISGLQQDQPHRRVVNSDLADQIDAFIAKLECLKELDSPFKLILDDPSGNSFIENPHAPGPDPSLHVSWYKRSHEQDIQLGIQEHEGGDEVQEARDDHDDDYAGGKQQEKEANGIDQEMIHKNEELMKNSDDLRQEVLNFPTNCPECNMPAETHMKLVQIPHFKEVVIMATNCEACGHRTNEVKAGGGVELKGKHIALHVTDVADMSRDLLKSDTCAVLIPELELELGPGALGGRFSTLEGLLLDIRDLVVDRNPFTIGDSGDVDMAGKLKRFGLEIDEVVAGRKDIMFILDDPAGNSYLQNVCAPDPDPALTVTDYERTFEQNEELGLTGLLAEGKSAE